MLKLPLGKITHLDCLGPDEDSINIVPDFEPASAFLGLVIRTILNLSLRILSHACLALPRALKSFVKS